MNTAHTISEVRKLVSEASGRGQSIGLVPTMGGLHDGHLSLIDAARRDCDFVVVSIFVNPVQFAPGEDLAAYPRTMDADLAACRARGVDAIFAPADAEMYPDTCATEVRVNGLSQVLCGASRPAHFAGVCTVVLKLLNIVQPGKAYFGNKDYQQATIIERMVADLDVPVEIVRCPIVREPDGLAMSTRNGYLLPQQRSQAAALHESLDLARRMIGQSHPPAAEVIEAIVQHLAAAAPDGEIDYVRIIDPCTLRDVQSTASCVLIALAVRLGRARLIDNVIV